MYKMSQQKQAANLRAVLVQVFAGHQQFVKDYIRFIHVLASDILTWPSTWNVDLVASKLQVKDTTEKGWEGKQTYGGRNSPPEYEEGYAEVATSVSLRLQADLSMRTFPRQFTAIYRAHVKDLRGFFTATQRMFEDSGTVALFGKMLRTVLPAYIKSNTYDSVAYAYDDIVKEAETASKPWQVTYNISKVIPARGMSKATPTGLLVWIDGEALMGSGGITPPPDDDYGSRWANSITRVAHRYIQATQKSAGGIQTILAQLLAGHRPYVKNWDRFIRAASVDAANEELWGFWDYAELLDYMTPKVTWAEWTETYDRGPSTKSQSVEVTDSFQAKIGYELNLRLLPRALVSFFREHIRDPKGFLQATTDLLGNKAAVNRLGMLIRGMVWKATKNPGEVRALLDNLENELSEVAQEGNEQGWSVVYTVNQFKPVKVEFKPSSKGLLIWVDANISFDAEPQDYEESY